MTPTFTQIYPYLFFILLIIQFSLMTNIAFRHFFPVKEGMADIGSAIRDAFEKPFRAIIEVGEKAVNGIREVFDTLQRVFRDIGVIGQFLGDVFVSIGSYLECSVFYIGNIFSYCIIYYFLYIAGWVIYFPFSMLFWATGTQEIENTIWDILSDINEFIVDITDFNILDYIFPDKCYKCQIRPLPKLNL